MKKFNPNDPLLTAFALGELEGQEAIEMAKLVDNDPEAKKFVEEIQETAKLVTLELEKPQEAPLRLAVEERTAIYEKTIAKRVSWRPWFLLAPAGGIALVALITLMIGVPNFQNYKATTQSQPVAVNDPGVGGMGGVAGLQPADKAPEKPQPKVAQGTQLTAGKADAGMPLAEPTQMAAMPVEEKQELAADESLAESEAEFSNSAAMAPPPPPNDVSADPMMVASQNVAAAPSSPTSLAQGGSMKMKEMKKGVGYGGAGMMMARGRSMEGISGRPMPSRMQPGFSTERYSAIKENDWKKVGDEALSTFSIDVDTASYSNVRRFLTSGQLPPPDAVRIEEMLNYFKYEYPQPKGNEAFSVTTEVTTAPWAPKNKLIRIGLKGRDVSEAKRPNSNLVFLLDVSGSMNDPAKLPLLKSSLKLLVDRLRENDRVGIVVYAGSEGIALESTPGTKKAKIMEALDKLEAGGSTNGEAGIQAAYKMAEKNFVKGGVNRVILATDGDFNVGTTSEGDLERLITEKAKTGVFLTVLGFGTGNYNDSTMTKLAGKGNGNAAYIDSLKEAQKVLVEQAGGTLQTIAKDVKIQVEFNPKHVQAYRLIGYEKRILAKEDFNDDTKDAGEIGAGHTVTALYEIVPPGVEIPKSAPKVDELKYQKNEAKPTAEAQQPTGNSNELLTVKLRFKKPDGKTSDKIEVPVSNEAKAFEASSTDMKFATAVAGFGMILRGSEHKGTFTLEDVIELTAQNSKLGGKMDDTRLELIELARKTRDLQKKNH